MGPQSESAGNSLSCADFWPLEFARCAPRKGRSEIERMMDPLNGFNVNSQISRVVITSHQAAVAGNAAGICINWQPHGVVAVFFDAETVEVM